MTDYPHKPLGETFEEEQTANKRSYTTVFSLPPRLSFLLSKRKRSSKKNEQ